MEAPLHVAENVVAPPWGGAKSQNPSSEPDLNRFLEVIGSI